MSSENNSFRLPVFNGKNFGLWKRQVMVVLKAKDLESSLAAPTEETKATPPWQKKDNEAQAILFGSMDQTVALKVVSCESAADIWTRLKEVYESTNVALVGKVFEEYYSYRKNSGDDMATHVSKVEALASHLETIGQKQTDVSIMSRLLHSLPASYSSLKEAWESVDPGKQTKAALISRLLSHGSVNEEGNKDMALVTDRGHRETSDSKQGKRRPGRCHNCNKFGHWARDCRSKPRENQEDKDDGVALVVGQPKSDRWIVDSGASQHTCCRKEWFSSIQPWSEKLQVGNQEWVESVGKGTVVLLCQVGNREEKISLHSVLYIPSMSHNLFSTGRAADKGASTMFSRRGCEITFNGKVIGRGCPKSNGLCYLDARVVGGSAMIAAHQRSLGEWHRSLGHADNQVIAEMANSGCVHGMTIDKPKDIPDCPNCAEGKATRASHTTLSSYEANQVGDRVDMDLIGPINEESLGKKRYILLTKDEFSDYSHIYMLNNKGEVAEKLQNYIGVFEAESGHRIRMIRTDNGSEFCNSQVKTLCDLEHIKLFFSAPYVPEQNGVAERNNRTIIEATRTLLSDSRLPKSLWAEAANTAVYLRNRIPKRGARVTPFELFWGRKPYIGHIVPFGTEIHSLINDRRTGKFDSKTEESFIVGYTERANSYRILVRDSMRVKISCDLIFRPHSRETGQRTGSQADETSVTANTSATEGQFKSKLTEYFEELQKTLGQAQSNSPREQQRTVESKDAFVSAANGGTNGNLNDNQSSSEITSPTYSEFTPHSGPPPLTPRKSSLLWSREISNTPLVSSTPLQQGSFVGHPAESPRHFDDWSSIPSPFQGRQIPRTPPRRNDTQQAVEITVPSAPAAEQPVGERPLGIITRSVKKRLGNLFIADQEPMIDEPKTFAEAMTGPNRADWKAAIDNELKAHAMNETWKITARPSSGTVLTAKWVFKLKRDEVGNVIKFKARLVARGFQQQEGRDFTETYAPVARSESIRILLAIATIKQLSVERFDVSTAFLHGTLEEDVYVDAPDGVKVRSGECLKLIKALYGLKQAPLAWHSTFDSAASAIGFTKIASDACVYTHKDKQAYMSIYVDDGLIIGQTTDICLKIINRLNQFFTTNRISGEIFLGMQLKSTKNGLHLSQRRYVADLLRRFNMEDCSGSVTPLVDSKILFDREGDTRADVPYRAAIGGLLYAALCTRPDILYPTILLSRFNEEPLTKHWAAVKRILSYLKRTIDYGLIFERGKSQEMTIDAFSDADWAGDIENRKSTSGVIIFLNRCPIIFVSRQQTTVAQSSTEAELIAACEATKELMWLVSFLSDLGLTHSKPTLYVDNKSTIALIKNNDTKRRSKHIDIKYHLVREKHLKGSFDLQHVGSNCQLADYLTKPIGKNQFQELLRGSNIVSIHDAGFEGECERTASPASCD